MSNLIENDFPWILENIQAKAGPGYRMDEQRAAEPMDNRIDICLKRELKRAARHKEPLSLMLIECHIQNETYRKTKFLPIFKQIAGIIRRIIRDEDYEIIFGRQLLLILPETFPDGAHTVASKIVKKIKTVTFKEVENLNDFEVHLIFGYAHFPDDGEERAQLLEFVRKSLAGEKEKLIKKLKEGQPPHTI